MRNKIMLRSLSVAAAALVCAVWSLAGCSPPSSEFKDNNEEDLKTPVLTDISIGFVLAENLLAAEFAPRLKKYYIVLDHNGQMEVSAAAGEETDIIIKIDGVTKEGASALFAAPAAGSSAVVIQIGAVWKQEGAEPDWYEVALKPAQTDDNADKTLSLLEARYQSETRNLFNTGFTQSSNEYTASLRTTDTGYMQGGGVVITASAASKQAAVQIKYGSAALPSTQNADGSVSALVPALPSPGNNSIRVEVKVTPGNNIGSRTYIVNIVCANRTVKWKGTVEYLGTEGLRIKGIVVQDVSGKSDSRFNAAIDWDKDWNMNGTSYPWTLEVEETYQPRYFTIKLEIEDEIIHGKMIPYSTGRLEPVVGAPENSIDMIVEAGAVGNTISDANELFSKLGTSATANKNYSLANDIDLTQYTDEVTGHPKTWAGPSGYSKTFFGNGFTISGLDLSQKTSGQVGLFSTLGNGAVIQDFTVEATTGTGGPLVMGGSSHFGGVVGNPGATTATIKNVTIRGILHFAPITHTGYLLSGGLIGEMAQNSNITISNCVSELNITVEAGTSVNNSSGTFGFGGLVGKAYGTLTIDKSYAAGDINIKHYGNRNIVAGGLVGEKNAGTLTITGSYAAGKVSVNSTNPGTLTTIAGGLVGWFNNNPTVTIKNSAALNESVIAQVPADKTSVSRRIIAATKTAITSNNGKLEKNFARADMVFGKDPNNSATANSDSGDVDGESVELEDFKRQETWTDRLGWSESNWDFSGLASGDWPKIKK